MTAFASARSQSDIACCAYLNIGGHCARSALESCMSIVDIEPLIALSVTANRSDAPRLMRRTRPIETWLMQTAVVKLRFINLSGYLRPLNKKQRMDRSDEHTSELQSLK